MRKDKKQVEKDKTIKLIEAIYPKIKKEEEKIKNFTAEANEKRIVK